MNTLPFLAFGALALASTASLNAAIIYQETFDATVNNTSLASVGWAAHSTAGEVRTGNTTSMGLSNLVGRDGTANPQTTGFAYTFAGNAGTSSDGAAGTNNFTAGTNPGLIWTNEYTVDRSTQSLDSISFHMYNSSTTATARIVVQIGAQWYATDTQFSTTVSGGASGFAANAVLQTFAFTTAASSWRLLNFDAPPTTDGTALSVSSSTLASDLPSGNITAFGLFFDPTTGSNGSRFDTFTLSATPIPEPAGWSVALGGVVLACVAGRRCRRPR